MPGRPAEASREPFEERPDRTGAVIGQRRVGVGEVAELFMLGPDAPLVLQLAAFRQRLGQLVAIFDRTVDAKFLGLPAKIVTP